METAADAPRVARQDPDPAKTYAWDNFRLASPYDNSCKRNWPDVLDPFQIEDGWFQIDLDDLVVKPYSTLADDIRDRVQESIERLKAREGPAFRDRKRAMDHSRAGRAMFEFDHPFLAKELSRQGIRRREGLPPLPARVLNIVKPELCLSE